MDYTAMGVVGIVNGIRRRKIVVVTASACRRILLNVSKLP